MEFSPRPARFTVDDLFDLPDWGLRGEVLDGRLLLALPPPRLHERVVDTLAARFRLVLTADVTVHRGQPVRLPDGDGPTPDLLVAAAGSYPRGVPAVDVRTVVEVVGADGHEVDRIWKRDRYAAAGIGCYWRVELAPWPGYRGPLPVVVVRVRRVDSWQEMVTVGGRPMPLPLAYGRDPDGAAATTPVRLDPATLTVRHATGR